MLAKSTVLKRRAASNKEYKQAHDNFSEGELGGYKDVLQLHDMYAGKPELLKKRLQDLQQAAAVEVKNNATQRASWWWWQGYGVAIKDCLEGGKR